MYENVVMNIVSPSWRYETLNGEEWLVVPAVMITEGVHNGSQGPLYYPPDELAKDVSSWNHKPIVIYHPTLNGEGVSACSPSVIESQGVGMLFNTSWDGKLKTECWLKENKLQKVDPRVLDSIKRHVPVEVSTGLFQTPEVKQGTWNNKSYQGIARNIRPDHLAILFDQVGACSLKDGAGLLRNAHALSHNDIKDHLHEELRTKHNVKDKWDGPRIHDVYPSHVVYDHNGESFKHDYKVKNDKASLSGDPEKVMKKTSYVTANGQVFLANDERQGPVIAGMPSSPSSAQLSEVMRKQQLETALATKYSTGGIQQDGSWGGWVTQIFANEVVYTKDGKLFRLPYTYVDDKVNFGTTPEENVTAEYKKAMPYAQPVDGTISPIPSTLNGSNMSQTNNVIHAGVAPLFSSPGEPTTTTTSTGKDSQSRSDAGGARKDMTDKMIAAGKAGEKDRKIFEGMTDEQFNKVVEMVGMGANQPVVPYGYAGIGDRSDAGTTHNRLTVNQYIDQAPPELREMLHEGLNAAAQEKLQLVKTIVANRNNTFTEGYLMTMNRNQLRGIAALAGNSQPVVHNYAGQGAVPMFIDNIRSQQQVYVDEVLPIPAMSWDKDEN